MPDAIRPVDPMSERRSALAGLVQPRRSGASVGVRLGERPLGAKVNLRGSAADPAFLAACGRVVGVTLPIEPNMTAAANGVTALWLGPDEWLLLAAPGEETGLVARLEEALADLHAHATDVTENWTILRLEGPRAAEVLAKLCPIDLHPRVTPSGQVAQSVVGHADAILHLIVNAADGATVDLFVRRSFAEYLWELLVDAALEFGVEAGPTAQI